MITNVFLNPYEQPENKLTYSFLCLLEHLSPETVGKVLSRAACVSVETVESHTVELLFGGGQSNPDGSIRINADSDAEMVIYLENKTWRRRADATQISKHLARLRPHKDLLLVIASDRRDKGLLAEVNDERITFVTWNEVLSALDELAAHTSSEKERFLLEQFVDYAERSGEAWRARMIEKRLADVFSDHLRISGEVEKFHNQCWSLIDSIKDEIVGSFPGQIGSADMKLHWGRLGAECELSSAGLGQWLFFGIYLQTRDHGIEFKLPYTPEFAVFLDIDRKKREQLAVCKGIPDAMDSLKREGFEFNFPEDKAGNPWRLCYWRDPINAHFDESLSRIRTLFQERLGVLFNSDFYRILLTAR